MSESIILEAIREIETRKNPARCHRNVINELRIMLDVLRSDKSSGERSLLNHLVADYVNAARQLADLIIMVGKH